MQYPVCVIEKHFLKQETDNQLEHDAGKLWQLFRHAESNQVSP
jgi:hypothetical protein